MNLNYETSDSEHPPLSEARLTLQLAERRLAEARRQRDEARAVLSEAECQQEALWLAENLRQLGVDRLRDKAADYARQHGAECALYGKPVTTGVWRLFRAVLAELASRAYDGEPEQTK